MDITRESPTLLNPPPFNIYFALKADKLVMVASEQDDLTTTIISNILDGILIAHKEGLSWVIGRLG